MIMATWELPWIYKCAGLCRRVTDILNHQLMFRFAYTRSIVHSLLGFVLFFVSYILIPVAVGMEVTSVLYFLAALTGENELDVPDAPPGPPTMGMPPFGTFV
mmetsp:Transcript_10869/g.15415  ORF Transcript_10869/g.15415 Transcript_10869/m.15415 type:complete len:102 (+) Transcript_10869:127-432(+)